VPLAGRALDPKRLNHPKLNWRQGKSNGPAARLPWQGRVRLQVEVPRLLVSIRKHRIRYSWFPLTRETIIGPLVNLIGQPVKGISWQN
jgi:hypothetical protein